MNDTTTDNKDIIARMTLAQIHAVVARDTDMCVWNAADECNYRADDLVIIDAHDRHESVSDADVERFRLAYVAAVKAMYECDTLFHELFECR